MVPNVFLLMVSLVNWLVSQSSSVGVAFGNNNIATETTGPLLF